MNSPTQQQIEQYLAEMRASLSRALQLERADHYLHAAVSGEAAAKALAQAIALQQGR